MKNKSINRFRLIINGCIFLGTLIISVDSGELIAQSSEANILAVREASNTALKILDEDAHFEFLTDDVLITTGNGTLLAGKDELKAYINSETGTPPMFWVRTPAEIIVNEERGLGWETGVWHGYYADDQNEESPVFHGNYAAQWVYQSGKWRIQSQIFVTLY